MSLSVATVGMAEAKTNFSKLTANAKRNGSSYYGVQEQ